MYVQLASADMTPQGRAIRDAAVRFGDGSTLPFTPCKKGYIPIIKGKTMYACPLHDKYREKRVKRERGHFRTGEFDLAVLWKRDSSIGTSNRGPGVTSAAEGARQKGGSSPSSAGEEIDEAAQKEPPTLLPVSPKVVSSTAAKENNLHGLSKGAKDGNGVA